ncbi:MAG: hypothetical protein QXO24_03255 [Candidatus Micrarchaeaceae archaeon]
MNNKLYTIGFLLATTTLLPLNYTNSSIMRDMAYSFAIPDFFLILTFAIIGIVSVRSKNLTEGIASGFVFSAIVYALVRNALNVNIPIVLGVLTFVMIMLDLFLRHEKTEKQEIVKEREKEGGGGIAGAAAAAMPK